MPNVAPAVAVPGSATATAGMQYAVEASFTDRLVDGSVATAGAIPASRLYKHAGGFTVTVSITDRHGATGSAADPLTLLKRNGRLC